MKVMHRHKVTVHIPWNGKSEEGLVAREANRAPWNYLAVDRPGAPGQPDRVVYWTLRLGTMPPIKEGLATHPFEAKLQAQLAADSIVQERANMPVDQDSRNR